MDSSLAIDRSILSIRCQRLRMRKPQIRWNILTMPEPKSSSPYRTLFEADLGLRLFACGRETYGNDRKFVPNYFGPALLSRGKITFTFFEKGDWGGILNGRRQLYRPGDLRVVCGGDSSGSSIERPGPHSKLTIGLALKQGEVANILLHRKFNAHYTIARPKEFVARFDELLQALAEPLAVRQWAVAGALLRLIAFILKETAPPLRPGGETALRMVEKAHFAQTWAQANLASKISLAEWARIVNLHPNSFEQVFKEQTGSSPKYWLETQRLQMACQYLLSTGNSVQQIATAVGYEDAFYFSRVFRRRFGQSPLQYR